MTKSILSVRIFETAKCKNDSVCCSSDTATTWTAKETGRDFTMESGTTQACHAATACQGQPTREQLFVFSRRWISMEGMERRRRL